MSASKMTQRYVITTFTLISCLLAGCQRVDPKLKSGLKEGEKLYSEGNYLGAERKLSTAISVGPSSPAVAEAYYLRGLSRLKLNRLILAEQDFQRTLKVTNREDLKTNANICLGSIYFKQKKWEKSYIHYQSSAHKLPILSPNDWVLYRLGLDSQRTGRWDEGKRTFARLIREFPGSEAAKLAKLKINYHYYTIQAGAFSSSARARRRVASLKRVGLPARIENAEADGKSLKVVIVGNYDDIYEASRELREVKRQVPDARIVP